MVIKSVAFVTLGCKLNFSESSTIAREFTSNGYTRVSASSSADIYVVNTCSVTEQADKKCRNLIRKLNKQNPNALIAVTGCYAQLKPDEILKIEGVDLVLGAQHKDQLFLKVTELKSKGIKHSFSCKISELETIFPAYSSDDRTRSFLKVQDGCDYSCTYCTIPLARGKSRNQSIIELVSEAKEIANKGIKEIVLTGVNTGDFGKSNGESFLNLLNELEKVDGIERYRISSIEPNLLTDEIINMIATGKKFLPHFHIPLQSGSDKILALMKRRYNSSMFRERILKIKRVLPVSFIGIDVIVGFPSEDDAEFNQTLELIKELKPSFLHVFPYSVRKDTIAASMMNQVPEKTKADRVKILTSLSDKLYEEFCQLNKGRVEEVLFESTKKGGKMFGYTRNYLKVEQDFDKSLIGKVVTVQL